MDKNNKNSKTNKVKEVKKTWLDLTKEELDKLNSKSACMYGRKSSTGTSADS